MAPKLWLVRGETVVDGPLLGFVIIVANSGVE